MMYHNTPWVSITNEWVTAFVEKWSIRISLISRVYSGNSSRIQVRIESPRAMCVLRAKGFSAIIVVLTKASLLQPSRNVQDFSVIALEHDAAAAVDHDRSIPLTRRPGEYPGGTKAPQHATEHLVAEAEAEIKTPPAGEIKESQHALSPALQ